MFVPGCLHSGVWILWAWQSDEAYEAERTARAKALGGHWD